MENVVMESGFWSGKRVLITGHTGFKGSWMTMLLSEMGGQLSGLALSPATRPNLYQLARLDERIHSYIGDIRDPGFVDMVVREVAPEIIIHMAAQPLVRYSYNHPVETYQTNVMGCVHLLDAVRRLAPQLRALINVTTDKCYENREWVWGYRETDGVGGFDPYSSSKGCAELVTSAFRNSYFPPQDYGREHRVAVATARAGNVIGGGDWSEDRLIPDILRAISDGRSALIRSPDAIRPWQHVLEPLYGYIILAERLYEQGPEFAQAWNFGPDDGDSRPVSWIADELVRLWGKGASWRSDQADGHPHEAHYLKLDCSKARQLLGWRPRWSLAAALQRIVAWQHAFARGEDTLDVCVRDIRDYLSGGR